MWCSRRLASLPLTCPDLRKLLESIVYSTALEGLMTAADEVQPIQLDDFQRAALLDFYASTVFGRPPACMDERAAWFDRAAVMTLLAEVSE